MFQHTAARRQLVLSSFICFLQRLFQHTAARRQLAAIYHADCIRIERFNTQPPEGSWVSHSDFKIKDLMFQHTAARRRLVGVSPPTK